jgi:hypothetical protein
MPGKDLTTAPERQLGRQVCKLISRAVETVEAASRAPELKRDGYGVIKFLKDRQGNPILIDGEPMSAKPEGMTEAEWNIACDANEASRDAPLYLTEAFDQVKTAQKIAINLQDAPPIAQFVVKIVEQKKYDIIDVTPEEKR